MLRASAKGGETVGSNASQCRSFPGRVAAHARVGKNKTHEGSENSSQKPMIMVSGRTPQGWTVIIEIACKTSQVPGAILGKAPKQSWKLAEPQKQ
jgi:hypothetical protein